jgi:hypothetical protein
VHTQLAAQQIYFPPANSKAVAAPEFAAMRPYGGQQLTTGAQAQVYADHFIANHLKAIGGHGDDDPFRQRDPAQVRRKL